MESQDFFVGDSFNNFNMMSSPLRQRALFHFCVHYLPTFIQLVIFLSFVSLLFLRAPLLNILAYHYNRCNTGEMERDFWPAVRYKCVLGVNGKQLFRVSSGSQKMFTSVLDDMTCNQQVTA